MPPLLPVILQLTYSLPEVKMVGCASGGGEVVLLVGLTRAARAGIQMENVCRRPDACQMDMPPAQKSGMRIRTESIISNPQCRFLVMYADKASRKLFTALSYDSTTTFLDLNLSTVKIAGTGYLVDT